MCVYNISETLIAKTPFIVWKRVELHPEGFKSCFATREREPQTRVPHKKKGRVLIYRLNKATTSSLDTTPGLYCYASSPFREPLLKCSVPAGTRYRTAQTGIGRSVILAETIIPIAFVK